MSPLKRSPFYVIVAVDEDGHELVGGGGEHYKTVVDRAKDRAHEDPTSVYYVYERKVGYRGRTETTLEEV